MDEQIEMQDRYEDYEPDEDEGIQTNLVTNLVSGETDYDLQ